MLGEVIKRMWSLVDLRAGPRQSAGPHHHPCPRKVSFSTWPFRPLLPSVKGRSLERERCWEHGDRIDDQTVSRPQHKLLRFWLAEAEICSSCGHPRQASWKFPCSLSLPPTHLQGSVSCPTWREGGGYFRNQQKIALTPKDAVQDD